MTIRRAPVATRVQDPDVDRILRNHDERVRELDRLFTATGFADFVRATVQKELAELTRSVAYAFGATSLTTSALRRWLGVPGAAAATSLAASTYYAMPSGLARAASLALSVGTGGTAGQTITYTLTEGGAAAENSTALKLTTASDFAGTTVHAGLVPINAGRALRIAVDKSGALAAAPANVVLWVLLSAA